MFHCYDACANCMLLLTAGYRFCAWCTVRCILLKTARADHCWWRRTFLPGCCNYCCYIREAVKLRTIKMQTVIIQVKLSE